jgi:hypothetical protein
MGGLFLVGNPAGEQNARGVDRLPTSEVRRARRAKHQQQEGHLGSWDTRRFRPDIRIRPCHVLVWTARAQCTYASGRLRAPSGKLPVPYPSTFSTHLLESGSAR